MICMTINKYRKKKCIFLNIYALYEKCNVVNFYFYYPGKM